MLSSLLTKRFPAALVVGVIIAVVAIGSVLPVAAEHGPSSHHSFKATTLAATYSRQRTTFQQQQQQPQYHDDDDDERIDSCSSSSSLSSWDDSCWRKALVCRGGARSSSSTSCVAPPTTVSSTRGGAAAGGDTSSETGASVTSSVFNLVKTILGVGILSLPAGIASFGNAPSAVFPALLMIAVMGILSANGFGLIGKVCAYTHTTSYRQAWEVSVGLSSSWIPAYATTCKTFLACLALSMVLADTFSSLTGFGRTQVLLAITVSVLLPLCCLKNLKSLAPFSLLGVMGILYTAVAITIRYFDGSYALPDGPLLQQIVTQPHFGDRGMTAVFSPKSCILICMLSTAYMAHFLAPKLYSELRNNTLERYYRVVGLSFGTAIVLICLVAGVGFLTFGDAVSGLVLNNYAPSDTLIFVARVAVALSLVFSYPLPFQGCRDGLLDLMEVEKMTDQQLNIMTIVLLSIVTLAAATLKDVSFVLAFGGATLGNLIIYIFPAIMYHHICQKQNRQEPVGYAIAMAAAVLGSIMGTIGGKMAIEKAMMKK